VALGVVVVVLGSVVEFVPGGAFGVAQVDAAQLQLDRIGERARQFREEQGRWPASEAELFVGEPGPVDPWGSPYVLRMGGDALDVVCLGADGREGGEGLDADMVRTWGAR
jgi:type II secretory pathway pseudopilin PulG